LDVIESMEANGASQRDITAAMQSSREAFINTAEAMGLTREQATALADELRLVPRDVATAFSTPGLDSSFAKVKAYVEYVERNKTQTITTNVRAVTVNGVSTTARALDRADGGVLTFADGGEHHVAQIAPAGAWRVWAEPETGGEAYIPLAPAKRARSEAILADVAARFGYDLAARRFADGGIAGVGGGGGQPINIENVWYPQADTLTDSAPDVARRSVHLSGAGRAGRG
jgi:hypothetical protein